MLINGDELIGMIQEMNGTIFDTAITIPWVRELDAAYYNGATFGVLGGIFEAFLDAF